MSARFGSTLHQRDTRADLFKNFSPSPAGGSRHASPGPTPNTGSRAGAYGYGGYERYGGYGGSPASSSSHLAVESRGSYRPATPNKKGQYSDAVLNELESQNDDQVQGILSKVRTLKDMTIAMGGEIRESSALAEKMNDTFDRARVRLRGTMNRMLVMAQRSGVPWKVWLGFFAAVILLFWYVKWS